MAPDEAPQLAVKPVLVTDVAAAATGAAGIVALLSWSSIGDNDKVNDTVETPVSVVVADVPTVGSNSDTL